MRHIKHFVCLCLRIVFHFDDIFLDWNVEGRDGTTAWLCVSWPIVYLQTLGTKCLLCPYVTFDISVVVSVIVFTVYGAIKHIYILDRNGSFFFLVKIFPSMMILSYYKNLVEWNSKCVSPMSSMRVYRKRWRAQTKYLMWNTNKKNESTCREY